MLDLERAYRDHNQAVFRFCCSRLRSDIDAEDAVQEVFARAAQWQETLEQDVLPWLITVARHVCLDEHRRRGHQGDNPSGVGLELEHLVDKTASGNPELTTIGRMRVAQLLGVLTPAERRAVREKWIFGHTGRGAATVLGVRRGTTSALLTRARKRLIAYLAKEGAAIGGIVVGGRLWLREHWQGRGDHAEVGATTAVRLAMVGAVCVVLVTNGGISIARATPPGPSDGRQASEVAHEAVAAVGPAAGMPGQVVARPGAKPASSAPVSRPMTVLSLIDPNHKAAPQEVGVNDLEASPNYTQDHTVLVAGTDTRCSNAQCSVLLRSEDGGATWTQLPAGGFSSTSLLLPRDSFSAGRFYAYGPSGLQVTSDGGGTFQSAGPYLAGYASLVDSGTSRVVVSNYAGQFEYQPNGTVSLLAAFPPGDQAAGPALQPAGDPCGCCSPWLTRATPQRRRIAYWRATALRAARLKVDSHLRGHSAGRCHRHSGRTRLL